MAATLRHRDRRDPRHSEAGPSNDGFTKRPVWPMIVMVTPKGWTGPKVVDGLQIEGTFRAHQVPLTELATKPEHLKMLETWMRSYRPEELFDDTGRPIPELSGAGAPGNAAHGMQSARQRRSAVARSSLAGFPQVRRARGRRPASKSPKPRARWAGCCATPSSSMRTISASSVRMRRRRTVWMPCSR